MNKEIEIEAKPVTLPFKLSQVAEHYGITTAPVISKLSVLAKAGHIFRHDIKKLKNGDYRLSSRAVALVFVNGHKSDNSDLAFIIEDLANFALQTLGNDAKEDCLTSNFLTAEMLTAKLQNEQQNRENEELQAMEKFMEDIAPINDCLH